MDLINKRRARRSDTSGVRADQGVLKGDGPLPALGDPESGAAQALLPEEVPSAHCRQCDTCVPLSAARTLSTHPTSGGLVTYFRCEEGHAVLYVDDLTQSASACGSMPSPLCSATAGSR